MNVFKKDSIVRHIITGTHFRVKEDTAMDAVGSINLRRVSDNVSFSFSMQKVEPVTASAKKQVGDLKAGDRLTLGNSKHIVTDIASKGFTTVCDLSSGVTFQLNNSVPVRQVVAADGGIIGYEAN